VFGAFVVVCAILTALVMILVKNRHHPTMSRALE
jgi:hypothetical protein